jgi:hypothetical protein
MADSFLRTSVCLFAAAWFLILLSLLLLFDIVLPYRFVTFDELWQFWLIGCVFVVPPVSLFIYASIQTWGPETISFKVILLGGLISALYGAALAFLLSRFIPEFFEPWRSVILPSFIYALTLRLLLKTQLGERLRKLSKPKND